MLPLPEAQQHIQYAQSMKTWQIQYAYLIKSVAGYFVDCQAVAWFQLVLQMQVHDFALSFR